MEKTKTYIIKLEELEEKGKEWLDDEDMKVLDEVIELLKSEYEASNPVEVIRQILDERRMSQMQLAKKMGMVRQNVSQLLNRGRKAPRYDSIARMVSALDCEVIIRPVVK